MFTGAKYYVEDDDGFIATYTTGANWNHIVLPANYAGWVGVDVAEDGTTTRRWRVENSWGDKIADKGYFTMSDDWFTEYVYEVAVPKALLPAEYQAALDEPATMLPAWDPMGALAD